MKFKKVEVALIIALIICMMVNFIPFSKACEALQGEVLRLHILANSDSAEDQALKLRVRDAVLERGKEVFDGAESLSQAKQRVRENIDRLTRIARSEITVAGYNYPVLVSLEKCFFETRYYETFTLPAGEYDAVKIIIGSGQGHNWWCVMFPQLCVAACAEIADEQVFSEEQKAIIFANPQFEVRFKCVEIYQKAKKYLKLD